MEKHLGSRNGNAKPSELRVTTGAKQLFQIQGYDSLTRRQYCDVGLLVSWLDLEIPTQTGFCHGQSIAQLPISTTPPDIRRVRCTVATAIVRTCSVQ
jgi:hypothetical protein